MVVCHCEAVTDRTVRATLCAGASSVDDIASKCGAGGRCGGCRPLLADLLDEHLHEQHCADPRRRHAA